MINHYLKLSGCYVEITSKCNLSCPYCYNDSNNKGVNLEFEEITKIIDELYEKKIYAIAISGGEPFLHPQILDIIDYCIKKNVRPNIITNLTLLSKRDFTNLLNKNVAIQITFDGVNNNTHAITRGIDSFKKNIELLKIASELKKTSCLSIRFNITKVNYTQIEDFIIFLNDNNITKVTFSFIKKIGRGNCWDQVFDNGKDLKLLSHIIYLIKELRDKYENMELSFYEPDKGLGCAFYADGPIDCVPRIDANGNVFLCQLFSDVSCCLGNIRNDKISNILASSLSIYLLNRIRERKNNKNLQCLNCSFNSYCLGGCPALIYQNNCNFIDNDGQCLIVKKFLKDKLMNRCNNGKN